MTPLAHRIVKDFTRPVKDRLFHDQKFASFLATNEIHCFETSKVFRFAWDIGGKVIKAPDLAPGLFLPANNTWVEWYDEENKVRIGMLIANGKDDTYHIRQVMEDNTGARLQDWQVGVTKDFAHIKKKIGENAERAFRKFAEATDSDYETEVKKFMARTTAAMMGFLCMINQPQTIRQKSHLPHAGLQRDLARSMGMHGKFPLRAWTELSIDMTPKDHAGEDVEARLSGRKCLHWVKSHLRFFSNGEWTIVEEHWRGDPALGIKQSRYVLTDKKHKLERISV